MRGTARYVRISTERPFPAKDCAKEHRDRVYRSGTTYSTHTCELNSWIHIYRVGIYTHSQRGTGVNRYAYWSLITLSELSDVQGVVLNIERALIRTQDPQMTDREDGEISREDILAYLEEVADEDDPPDDPTNTGDVELYLIFINLLDDETLDRIPKFNHPLTGERLRKANYDNHILLAEIVRVAETLGEPPTSTEFKEHGVYSLQPYKDRFGTFPRAVEVAGYEPRFTTTQQKTK